MSRERLEEVKTVNSDIKRFHDEFDHKQADIAKCYFYEKYGNWLIEQAERVQELEEESYNAHLERLLDRKEQQNQRYKQALEEIIRQHELEDEIDDYDFMWNVKQIARQALEE